MKKKIILTADGSHTLFVPELNEHYHSVHGAIRESRHVFTGEGFQKLNKIEIKILEVGFGTGLNALLTFDEAKIKNVSVEYYAVEPFPLNAEEIRKLNYCLFIGSDYIEDIFYKMHQAQWGATAEITKTFILTKINASINSLDLPQNRFDLIYFDAFAPTIQPELWTREIFCKLYQSMCIGGIIVTYSAKGEIRRMWSAAGLRVERLPGPPGKREMLRGIKVVEPGVT